MAFVTRIRRRLLAVIAPLVAVGVLVAATVVSPKANVSGSTCVLWMLVALVYGSLLIRAFQSGRFFDGGASNIGFSTTTNGGTTWG